MENSKEVDDLLELYFTVDELKNISSYEKLHYFNILKNYEMLISLGLNPPLPKFLQQKVNCEKETTATSNDSEGLVQDFHSKIAKGKRKAVDPRNIRLERRAPVSKTPREDSPREEKFLMQKQLEISKNEGKVGNHYPKRKVSKKNYKEVALLSAGEIHYCEDCSQEYKGPCPYHGPMTPIANTKVTKDKSMPQQALTSFPSVSVTRKATRLFPDVNYHTCDRCGQRFTDVDDLWRHEKRHTRVNRGHRLLTHIGDRPYACKLCPSTFAQKGHLKMHSIVHSDEKTHACNICHSAFARDKNLLEHKRSVHSKAKQYPCAVCGKVFDDDGARMRHQHVHSAGSPHCCPHCDRKFSMSGHLKQHMARLHTQVFLYSCQFCEMGFWTVGELKLHVQKNHLVV